MMGGELTRVSIDPSRSVLDQVRGALVGLKRLASLDETTAEAFVEECLVVSDEVLSNILKYSCKTEAELDILFIAEITEEEYLRLVFRDNGTAFNPLSGEDPLLDRPVEEREVGGMGLLLIRSLTDSQSYQYTDRINELVLLKKLNR